MPLYSLGLTLGKCVYDCSLTAQSYSSPAGVTSIAAAKATLKQLHSSLHDACCRPTGRRAGPDSHTLADPKRPARARKSAQTGREGKEDGKGMDRTAQWGGQVGGQIKPRIPRGQEWQLQCMSNPDLLSGPEPTSPVSAGLHPRLSWNRSMLTTVATGTYFGTKGQMFPYSKEMSSSWEFHAGYSNSCTSPIVSLRVGLDTLGCKLCVWGGVVFINWRFT